MENSENLTTLNATKTGDHVHSCTTLHVVYVVAHTMLCGGSACSYCLHWTTVCCLLAIWMC